MFKATGQEDLCYALIVLKKTKKKMAVQSEYLVFYPAFVSSSLKKKPSLVSVSRQSFLILCSYQPVFKHEMRRDERSVST